MPGVGCCDGEGFMGAGDDEVSESWTIVELVSLVSALSSFWVWFWEPSFASLLLRIWNRISEPQVQPSLVDEITDLVRV
jgi:hypothetical protein